MARTVQINLGTQFPTMENIQRMMVFFSDETDAAPPQSFASAAQSIRPLTGYAWLGANNTVPNDHTEGYRLYRNGKIIADGTSYGKRMRLHQRESRRVYGVDQPIPPMGGYTTTIPDSIDLAAACGHDLGGHDILGGISNSSQSEYLLVLYFPGSWTLAAPHGDSLHCILQAQKVIEIENHGMPASESKPLITSLVN